MPRPKKISKSHPGRKAPVDSTKPAPLVSIVIPVFNRWDLTRQCLGTLDTVCRGTPFEVIVIDNASTDETRESLRYYPNVHKIFNTVNLNFATACNQGAQAATGKLVCFLNNDTLPFNHFLEPMISELQSPDVGVVGSKLIYPNDTIQHCGVAFMRETKFPYHFYKGKPGNFPPANHRRELQCVTGACMMVNRDRFLGESGFDAAYKNGGEDIAFCLRMHRKGLKIVYRPDSALIHLESQSPGRMTFNDYNCAVFYSQWGQTFLSDEDMIYFEDGLHRIGYRETTASTTLRMLNPVLTENPHYNREFAQWQIVSYCQKHAIAGNWEKVDNALMFPDDWPEDYAVREWAAELCAARRIWRNGFEHLQAARRLRAAERKADLKNEINSILCTNIYPPCEPNKSITV